MSIEQNKIDLKDIRCACGKILAKASKNTKIECGQIFVYCKRCKKSIPIK